MSCRSPEHKTPVVVVESHQHAVEHYHFVLRRRRTSRKARNKARKASELSPWTLIHFDAHPDLACPNETIPVAACFRPRDAWVQEKDFYDLLDSSSTGIAEWILPLVLAGDLSTVKWIRPREQAIEQLPLGTHSYRVGAWTPNRPVSCEVASFLDLPHDSTVKVDWNCPYYTDDNSVVPGNQLLLPQLLHLDVTAEPVSNLRVATENVEHSYCLDICLDFFACRNPYLTDLEERMGAGLCKALVDVVRHSIFYNTDGTQCNAREDQSELVIFRSKLLQLVRHSLVSPLPSLRVPSEEESMQREKTAILDALLGYYESATKASGEQVLDHFLEALQGAHCKEESIGDASVLERDIAQALENITMPHEHEFSVDLQVLEASLDNLPDFPMLISIARSANDGFTPHYLVEDLQRQVLERLHRRFCGTCECASVSNIVGSCQLGVVFDYGEWEGSTLDDNDE